MSTKKLFVISIILLLVIIFLTSSGNRVVKADLVSPLGFNVLGLFNPYSLSFGSGNFLYNIYNPNSIYSSPYYANNPYMTGYTPEFSFLRGGYPYYGYGGYGYGGYGYGGYGLGYGYGSGFYGLWPPFY